MPPRAYQRRRAPSDKPHRGILAFSLLCGLMLWACGTFETPGQHCSEHERGQTRCTAASVHQWCDGSTWQDVSDCVSLGLTCGIITGETYGCKSAAGSRGCDFIGHASAAATSYYDPDLLPLARLRSYGSPGTPEAYEMLRIDHWPHNGNGIVPGQQGTVSLGGENAHFETCGLCVVGFQGNDAFFARSGTAEVSSPTRTGDLLSLRVQDAVLAEVYESGNAIPDGKTWCINDLTLGVTTQSWSCEEEDMAEGARVCATDGDGQYVVWECIEGAITIQADCSAKGMRCSVSDDPAAHCY